MLGAIAGDIIGSPFEWNNTDDRFFELCHSTRGWYRGREVSYHPRFTDETVLTLAVAKWLTTDKERNSSSLVRIMREMGHAYPDCNYGPLFKRWLESENPHPFNSYGNGAAARVSPIGLVADNLYDAIKLARQSAEITHNHPEGIKGAEAMVQAVWMAKHGRSKEDIQFALEHDYGYDFSKREDEISPFLKGYVEEPIIVNGEDTGGVYLKDTGRINSSCQLTVPAAVLAFLKGDSFEDTVRRAVALGGDSDTIASMAGAIAEPFYGGVPEKIRGMCDSYLTPDLRNTMTEFENRDMRKNMHTGKVEKHLDDSFGAIRIKGQPVMYIVSPYRKELIAALQQKFGEGVHIVSPREAKKIIDDLCTQTKTGTYLEKPRPDIRTLYYQNGEFRTAATREGAYLPPKAEREDALRSFLGFHDYALQVKSELQKAVGYTGEGSIHFENAYYPVVYGQRVEVWRGDCFAGAVGVDNWTGLLKTEIGGDMGKEEHGVARTFSVFSDYGTIEEALARFCLDEGKGAESAQYAANIDIANNDVATSKDETLLAAIDNPSQTPKIGK